MTFIIILFLIFITVFTYKMINLNTKPHLKSDIYFFYNPHPKIIHFFGPSLSPKPRQVCVDVCNF